MSSLHTVSYVVVVTSRFNNSVVEVLGPFTGPQLAEEAVDNLDLSSYRAVRKTLHPVLDAAYMDES